MRHRLTTFVLAVLIAGCASDSTTALRIPKDLHSFIDKFNAAYQDANDPTDLESYWASEKNQKEYTRELAARSDMDKAFRNLVATIRSDLGDKVAEEYIHSSKWSEHEHIEQASVVMKDESTATARLNGSQPVMLVKSTAGWRVEPDSSSSAFDELLGFATYKCMQSAYTSATRGVDDGTLKTSKQVNDAVHAAVNAWTKKYHRSSIETDIHEMTD